MQASPGNEERQKDHGPDDRDVAHHPVLLTCSADGGVHMSDAPLIKNLMHGLREILSSPLRNPRAGGLAGRLDCALR